MKQNNKTHILSRYTFITFLFLLFAVALVIKLFNTTVIDAHAWNERAHRELSRESVIDPERGNLLASNGNILACNLKVYDIKLDLRHDKINKLDYIPMSQIDALADSLDLYYPRIKDFANASREDKEKYSWHTKFRKELAKDPSEYTRALRLVKKGTMLDYERIRQFPFIKEFKGKGSRIPLYTEARNIRMYPYGKMAYRSIGRVNEDSLTGKVHGYSGLEAALDELLYGKPGVAKKVALTTGISNWTKEPAVRGYDVLTTIDIDLQDMLEEELYNICHEAGAEWGTAILMEVATGEIKAISNIEKLDDGSYGEALNRAVLPFEPGSVMKPISLMIAFEDGLVNRVTDLIDCGPFMRTTDPHAPGTKSMKQVIEMSSNTGIARVIFRGYSQDPTKFYDRLKSIGFFEPMNTGIRGECIPRIKRLEDKTESGLNITMTARHLDLARQAYGYNTEIPPLYTLSIYNAIANNGKYVRPHLMKGLRDENGHDSIMPISYIRDSICSRETARKVRECIHEVVWGEHGTARLVRDDRVKVVGKTGTAYPVEKGGYNHAKRRYAFAGFFPYDNPKYSCMALVLSGAGNSANRTSGQVVKNMAVKMYSRGMLNNSSTYTETRSTDKPTMSGSDRCDSRMLASTLSVPGLKQIKTTSATDLSTVPDVRGYDIPTALKMLEERGLNVRVAGAGRVVGQSIAAGSKVRRGDKITLTLKI